jgi:hypothetical protein
MIDCHRKKGTFRTIPMTFEEFPFFLVLYFFICHVSNTEEAIDIELLKSSCTKMSMRL